MRSRAKELSFLCEMFLATTDTMRTNMNVIPEKPEDKNYVDQWLEKKLAEFAKQETQSWYNRAIHGKPKEPKRQKELLDV